MTTTAVLAAAAAAGALIGVMTGAAVASWAWAAVSGETRRDPARHRPERNQP